MCHGAYRMPVFAIDKLMKETRRVAAEYHEATGQALPVTQELSRYDVKHLLSLTDPEETEIGVDGLAQWEFGAKVQIKGRVIFNEEKAKQRIGQLNLQGGWECVVLIIYGSDYEPMALYVARRAAIEEVVAAQSANKRGLLSVAKFKAISRLIWTKEQGLELDEVWEG